MWDEIKTINHQLLCCVFDSFVSFLRPCVTNEGVHHTVLQMKEATFKILSTFQK